MYSPCRDGKLDPFFSLWMATSGPFHTIRYRPSLSKHAHSTVCKYQECTSWLFYAPVSKCRHPQALEVAHTHTKTHSRTPHTGAVYPSGDGDVGPCRPMSVLGEGKYFHCEGIFSCQQSDRALARDRRFPWGLLWPPERRGGRSRILWGRRVQWGLLFPDIKNMVDVNTSRAGQIAWGQDVTDER